MTKNCYATLLTIAFIILLSGCSSTKLVSSVKTPGIGVKDYSTILVVGMLEKPGNRQVFEEIVADELRRRGINAISSYTIKTLRDKPDRKAFRDAMAATGAQALLASRITDVKNKKDVDAGYVMTDRGKTFDYDYYDYYYYNYTPAIVSYATFDAKPVNIIISSKTIIETSLFDSKSGKPVWRGSTSETAADDVIDSTKSLAENVADALVELKLLKSRP